MEVALRGLGDSSTSGSWCDPTDPFWCVICGNCLATSAAGTTTGTNPLPMPPAVQPPAIDTNPNSPTYGQAIINGVAVGTPAQAQSIVSAQIQAQAATENANVQAAINQQAAAASTTASCNWFQTFNTTSAACQYSIVSPVGLLVIAAIAVLAFFKK